MNAKHFKFIILLTCFYSLNIFGITKYMAINFLEKSNLRFLLDSKASYDTSKRDDKEDINSIKNCQKSDDKYFFQYISGYNVTFDKSLNTKRVVSNNI